jgi:hypothetical protein
MSRLLALTISVLLDATERNSTSIHSNNVTGLDWLFGKQTMSSFLATPFYNEQFALQLVSFTSTSGSFTSFLMAALVDKRTKMLGFLGGYLVSLVPFVLTNILLYLIIRTAVPTYLLPGDPTSLD